MNKCQCFDERTEKRCPDEAVWAWQPFGPDEYIAGSFARPGSHYRGWPVTKVCDSHKDRIDRGRGTIFTCKGKKFEHLGGGSKVIINVGELKP